MDSELAAALARVEERQAVYERVAHEIVSAIGVQTEMLTAIMEAVTVEPGPSPIAIALQQIATAMREQNTLLTNLPDTLATIIREEMTEDMADLEDASMEGAFERDEAARN